MESSGRKGSGRGETENWGRGGGGRGGRGRNHNRPQHHQSSGPERQWGRGGETQMSPSPRDVNQGQGPRPPFISHGSSGGIRGGETQMSPSPRDVNQGQGPRAPFISHGSWGGIGGQVQGARHSFTSGGAHGGDRNSAGLGATAWATVAGRGLRSNPPAIPSTPPIQAPVQNQKTSSEPVHDTLTSETEKSNEIVPIKRPDTGGRTAIKTCKLRANHFAVNFSPNTIIWHYNVEVCPENPPTNGRPVKITKSNLCKIRDKHFSDNKDIFPLSKTAYDGEKNIFSAIPLRSGTYKVTINEGEGTTDRTYIFTIEQVSELKLSKLADYLAGKVVAIPRDILQASDVVFKENPVRNMISVGRCFFSKDSTPNDCLGHGVLALSGSIHSLKTTMQGLALCLDRTVLPFYDKMPILNLLQEQIYGFDVSNFAKFRREVEGLLKGLKVNVTHRQTRERFTIAELTEKITRQLSFMKCDPNGQLEPRNVRVVDYFRETYGKEIKYLDIPCLNLGRGNKRNDVPMEFCILAPGQRYPKEFLDNDAARKLKSKSVVSPREREREICNMVKSKDGPCGGEVIQNFGMEVSMNMTRLTGRVIDPPELKVGRNGTMTRITVDAEKRQWNLVGKSFVEGKRIDCWAILDFSSQDRYRLNANAFVPQLMNKCNNLGMVMEEPFKYLPTSMNKLSNSKALLELLESISGEARKRNEKLQMVLCVMTRKDPGYETLKFLSETKVGIVTQCCLSSCKFNDQYFSNLALKINAKLGGSNVELFDRFSCFKNDAHVMFIGADVNHPGKNAISPSIAAVVATMNWPAANRYAASLRPQDPKTEKILNFGEMCLGLVKSYARINNAMPGKIIVFRDGVSDDQFNMVLNEELRDLKRTFQAMNYHPTVSLIVAQKRHQTRFFPEGQGDGAINGNVLPGTVVDTKIVHNSEFNFFLNSHYGILGTSKPTHYYVLWDEHKFTSDAVQKLIYDLCFTFARCTKPVSLATPVYYADLAAYRGRMYCNELMQKSKASPTASSSSIASTMVSSFKLHGDLENYMFFI